MPVYLIRSSYIMNYLNICQSICAQSKPFTYSNVILLKHCIRWRYR